MTTAMTTTTNATATTAKTTTTNTTVTKSTTNKFNTKRTPKIYGISLNYFGVDSITQKL